MSLSFRRLAAPFLVSSMFLTGAGCEIPFYLHDWPCGTGGAGGSGGEGGGTEGGCASASALSNEGAFLWGRPYGEMVWQSNSIAVDPEGNAVMAGSFWIDDHHINGFIAKLDAGGQQLWRREFGGGNNSGRGIAVDGDGNILVTGNRFDGEMDLGMGPLQGGLFLAKYNASGNLLWSRGFAAGDEPMASGIAVDSAGSVFIAGTFAGTADFGLEPLTTVFERDIFVAKFDAEGHSSWSKRLGGWGVYSVSNIAVDASGAVFITGDFGGELDVGNEVFLTQGETDAFLAKLDADGNPLWGKRFGDERGQQAGGVAVDGTGDVLLTGSFAGTIDVGGALLTSSGGKDVFLAKLDSSGNRLWSKRFGDTNDQEATGIAVDGNGDVLLIGLFSGLLDFGGCPLPGAGREAFLARFDHFGRPRWSKHFSDIFGDLPGTHVTGDAAGNALLLGYFNGTIDLGGGPIGSPTPSLFIANFAP